MKAFIQSMKAHWLAYKRGVPYYVVTYLKAWRAVVPMLRDLAHELYSAAWSVVFVALLIVLPMLFWLAPVHAAVMYALHLMAERRKVRP